MKLPFRLLFGAIAFRPPPDYILSALTVLHLTIQLHPICSDCVTFLDNAMLYTLHTTYYTILFAIPMLTIVIPIQKARRGDLPKVRCGPSRPRRRSRVATRGGKAERGAAPLAHRMVAPPSAASRGTSSARSPQSCELAGGAHHDGLGGLHCPPYWRPCHHSTDHAGEIYVHYL